MQAAGRLGIGDELDHEVDLWLEGSFQILGPGLEIAVVLTSPKKVKTNECWTQSRRRGNKKSPSRLGLVGA